MPLTASSPLPVPAGMKSAAPSGEHPRPFWLALVFPSLALQACGLDARSLCAVTLETRRGQAIYRVSPVAQRRGVQPQMGLAAALALCPDLVHAPRDRASEMRHLRALLAWSRRFTPTVSHAPPDALLLEVRASLRLFDGAAALYRRLRRELECRGYDHLAAGAPTAQAGLLLARNGQDRLVEQVEGLRSVLGELPIAALDMAPRLRWRLHRAGLRKLRDLWRLPRDGLSRRFGRDLQDELDRLLGKRPDPRVTAPCPEPFCVGEELPAPVADSIRVLAVVRRLLPRLVAHLRQCDSATSRLHLELVSARLSATGVTVCARDASRDEDHWLCLCAERLRRLQLPAPVEEVRLLCRDMRPYTPPDQQLFARTGYRESWSQRLSEIEARLGAHCLWQPALRDDHRPECAWGKQVLPWPAGELPAAERPLWLLQRPQRLVCRQGLPWYQGRLVLCGGPERIETGWWDGAGCRRDYHVARDEQGGKLWVFRDLGQQDAWYLHGWFA